MSLIQELKKRGYFYQCTNAEELDKLFAKKSIAAYIGFDATAKSLHVGSLMQIMLLRLLQQHGHKPIVVIGGTTTKIGDPTFKEEARKLLPDLEIQENILGIKKSLSKFIQFGEGKNDAIMVNNSDWLEKLNYIDFLRDFGRLFSVNRMITMDSVKMRLEREQPLTFLEMNYMILQAYDFYHLNKEYDCALQMGGSDQWGNIVTGVDLVRRVSQQEVFGLTTPLLTTSSGAKMGKSISGAVWLNEDMLSPYDYYQYWRNSEDDDVIRFAKLYCEYNDEDFASFEAVAKYNINEAKKRLAYRVTQLCHGQENADRALQTATSLFEAGGIDNNLPTVSIAQSRLKAGIPAYDLFFEAGLASSKSEARRLIKGKGAKINDEQILEDDHMVTINDIQNKVIKLSAGKKRHALVKAVMS